MKFSVVLRYRIIIKVFYSKHLVNKKLLSVITDDDIKDLKYTQLLLSIKQKGIFFLKSLKELPHNNLSVYWKMILTRF